MSNGFEPGATHTPVDPPARLAAFRALVEFEFARLVVAPDERLDDAPVDMLGRLGEFLDSDRAYVIRLDYATRTTWMTHEWCRDGIKPTIHLEQGLDFDLASNMQERLDRLEMSAVRDVELLPPEWGKEKEYLRSQDIRSILEVPFTLDGRLSGFIGFDWVERTGQWLEDDLPVLRAAAALTERVLSRTMTGDTLTSAVDQLRAVSDELERSERRHRAELEYRATHDDLTGLANRAAFLTRLEEACRRAADEAGPRVGLLFIDLDDFKHVNDSLGHDAGDRLLCELASRLRSRLRPDDLLARIGGDELTILLESTDEVAARAVASTARVCIAAPVKLGGVPQRVTASIGIALWEPGCEPADLLRGADAAVYRAKTDGGDRYVLFDEELRRQVEQHRKLDLGLRHATERGEILVHYQPEVDLRTGEVLGVEALARWKHPELGLLPAGRFIDVAEDNGTVLAIGRHVLETASRDLAGWRRDELVAPGFVLRINLSARQLADPLLVPHLRSTLEDSGVAPGSVCLELTETAVMRDPTGGLRLLQSIRALGVRLAIDDFGTGYSSLSMLKRLPIDVVKIDHTFVDGLPDDAENLAIVRAVMSLAASLHLDVTAEGVERPEQAKCLVGVGCTRGQGFLYSRPVGSTELLARIGVGAGSTGSEAKGVGW